MIKGYSVPRDFSWIKNYKLNIPQPRKRESWDENKDILTKEIKSVMPTVEETVIQDKIEEHIDHKKTNTTKTWQSLRNLTTGTSQSQSKPASSERNCRYMFCKCSHQC